MLWLTLLLKPRATRTSSLHFRVADHPQLSDEKLVFYEQVTIVKSVLPKSGLAGVVSLFATHVALPRVLFALVMSFS